MILSLIGDSLSAGHLGIPYSRYLDLPPDYEIVNRGRDGDTVRGVLDRLTDALRKDQPDSLVIQVGANDLLLPEMQERGGEWQTFVAEMASQGSIPTASLDDFADIYAELLSIAESWALRKIVAVTVPPIGEDLESNRNRRRREINTVIRRITAETGCRLADAGAAFEAELAELRPISEFFFGKPADFITDVRTVRRTKGAAALSEERGLYLTMDGAHLNEKGAALMAGTIRQALLDDSPDE